TQRASHLLIDPLRRHVALNGQLVDDPRIELHIVACSPGQIVRLSACDRFMRHAHDGRSGSVLLKAAPASTTAGMPFRFDAEVAEFSCHAVHAMPESAIQ